MAATHCVNPIRNRTNQLKFKKINQTDMYGAILIERTYPIMVDL